MDVSLSLMFLSLCLSLFPSPFLLPLSLFSASSLKSNKTYPWVEGWEERETVSRMPVERFQIQWRCFVMHVFFYSNWT